MCPVQSVTYVPGLYMPVFRHPSQRAVPSRNALPLTRSAARSIALLLPSSNITLRSCGCKGAPSGFWLLPLRSLQKIAFAIR